jgi:DNA-binding Lrp family transcriptional regulator
MQAYVLINARTGEIKDILRHLRTIVEVKTAQMTFGPYDAVALVEASDLEDLGRVLAGSIQVIPGIEDTLTCIAVDV